MEAWTMATGIHFVQSVTADLVFDDEDLGNAYASFNLDNMGGTNANGTGLIVDASINIGKDWIEDDWTLNDGVDLDSYSFQTYIHEIGHALGLGHAGPYNGSADYTQFEGGDAAFINDSWQMSVMSYFSQTENTFIDATFAYVVTPMLADIQAIHQLYNTSGNIRDTDTIYGVGSTAGGYYDTVLGLANPVTFTVVDDGGVDTIDVSVFGSDQMINLNGNSISSIAGNVGNMSIMDGTEIENVVMGSGDDVVYANDVGNDNYGGAGTDIVSYIASDAAVTVNLGAGNANSGYAQGDTLTGIQGVQGSEYGDILIGASVVNLMDGGDGDDSISVGGGDDIVEAGDGNDSVIASAGNDEVNAGEGNDDVYGGV
ncbi:M10 family metallopeptidase C-terminal domain-containing protein [Thalassobium sp. R2A62]|jgi:serralysin|uniref:M10 family metallopeptidase C-terminal domain-containing protein n=1 Tax=Thalassobium sp. R2A62 TaxID=633131 RepID=UPI0006833B9A|nr:M10 family metallopeptidase C-terminal domain-containing protein [Thalassobium sp. R2A62]